MKKISGNELSVVDGEDALPAGAALISFATKSTDLILQPGFLEPADNFVQASTFAISSLVGSGSAAFALMSPETTSFAPDIFKSDTSISAGAGAISAARAPLVLFPDAPLSNQDIASVDEQIGSIVSVASTTGFTINLEYDTAASAPGAASFRAGIQQAANLLAAAITDKITVNLIIHYSGTGGGAFAGPDGGVFDTYSQVRASLINNATPGDHTFDALLAGSFIQGQTQVAVWNAQEKLFGQLSPNDATTDDGSATFATDINPNLLVGVALHELTHALGRIPYGPQPDIFDLFRFTSPGNRFFDGYIPPANAAGPPAGASYFSLDGGNTKLADYGQWSDPSDFLNPANSTNLPAPHSDLTPNDPFNEQYGSGALQQLTAVDLKQLDALGFHLSSSAPSVAISDASISEGSSGARAMNFTVTRSGGSGAFDVNFTTADGSATVADHDYVANSGTLHFGIGVNTQTIQVTINGDTKIEPNETFFVNLSGATNGASISDGQGLGTILTDELNRAPRDFNADATSDVFWRNNATGHTGIWEMHNNVQTWHDLGGSGTDHRIAAIGDFNGDATADLFWRNDSTGHVGIWEMHNNVQTWRDLGFSSGVDHKVVGVGDFNADGASDLIWRNDSTGHVGTWEMHNNVQTWHDLGGSGVDHKVVGVGDFNGDSTSDVLWRNDTTGHTGTWEMHNNVQTWRDLGASGADHKVVGVGDFNGDGTADVLWRNDATGHVGIWEMHNGAPSWVDLGGSGTDHKVAGIGDYNGDGASDIFWRNDATGHTGIWEMHNDVPTWRDLGGSGVDHSFIV
jgi:hypothetical protein